MSFEPYTSSTANGANVRYGIEIAFSFLKCVHSMPLVSHIVAISWITTEAIQGLLATRRVEVNLIVYFLFPTPLHSSIYSNRGNITFHMYQSQDIPYLQWYFTTILHVNRRSTVLNDLSCISFAPITGALNPMLHMVLLRSRRSNIG